MTSIFFRSFEKSWFTFKKTWQEFVVLSAISLLLFTLIQSLFMGTQEKPVWSFVVMIICLIVMYFMFAGWLQLMLLRAEHKTTSLFKIFQTHPKIWLRLFISKFVLDIFILLITFVLSIPLIIRLFMKMNNGTWTTDHAIISIITTIALFFIVTIIVRIYFFFLPYIIMETQSEPFSLRKVLKNSLEISRKNRFKLFVYSIFFIFFNIMGAISFGIGLFITIPMTMLAYTHVYLSLKK